MTDDTNNTNVNGTPDGGFNPDDAHFSDEELEAALADFEQEFAGESDGTATGDDTSDPSAPVAPEAGESPDIHDIHMDIPDDASEIDASVGFEDELQGLLGNKAKAAVIVTRVATAELLAAFCQLSDISADCLGSQQGAVAVLRNLDGDSPEASAKDLTTVVSGMSVILAVNRADQLDVTLYMHGQPGQTFAPPLLFNSTPRVVEDLLLGITDLGQLKAAGENVVDSASLDHKAAMEILAKHTRLGRGGSTRGSSVE